MIGKPLPAVCNELLTAIVLEEIRQLPGNIQTARRNNNLADELYYSSQHQPNLAETLNNLLQPHLALTTESVEFLLELVELSLDKISEGIALSCEFSYSGFSWQWYPTHLELARYLLISSENSLCGA